MLAFGLYPVQLLPGPVGSASVPLVHFDICIIVSDAGISVKFLVRDATRFNFPTNPMHASLLKNP